MYEFFDEMRQDDLNELKALRNELISKNKEIYNRERRLYKGMYNWLDEKEHMLGKQLEQDSERMALKYKKHNQSE